LFKIIILVFLFLNISSFAQNIVSYYTGRLYIGYDIEPDEVFIDSVKVDLSKQNVYGVDTGYHIIEASRSCYYPIQLSVSVKQGHTYPVHLQFKHITTPEYKIFVQNNVLNYFLLHFQFYQVSFMIVE